MAVFEVIEGDFPKGYSSYLSPTKSFMMKWHSGQPLMIPARDVEFFAVASEESVKKAGGTIGWGIAGAAIFGPVGLLAGAVLGKRSKTVTFVLKFSNGRKFMAKADEKAFAELMMAVG